MELVRTNSSDTDFINLVKLLDADLEVRDGDEQIERLFQETLLVEPVKVEAEAMQAGLFSKLNLPAHDSGIGQVVKTEVTGHPWLVVSSASRQAATEIRPFGKTMPPPLVVFGNRVKLRKIERYDLCLRAHCRD